MTDQPKVTPGVARTSLHSALSDNAMRVDRIVYGPGAHTHWHAHLGEQVLYGEVGHGWVKFDGQPRMPIDQGRIVYVPVGAKHWHGACADDELVHLAFTAGGDTIWLGEVTASEYSVD
jgi:quercetin dioxygenase-like cupin family protein